MGLSFSAGLTVVILSDDKKDFAKLKKAKHVPQILTPYEFLETILPQILKAMGD